MRVWISAWAALHLGLGEGNDPWALWGDEGPTGRTLARAAAQARRDRRGRLELVLEPRVAQELRSAALDCANALDDALRRRDARRTPEEARLDRLARDAMYRDTGRLLALLESPESAQIHGAERPKHGVRWGWAPARKDMGRMIEKNETRVVSGPERAERYEVAVRGHGRPLCRKDGPAQGLLDWPRSKWTRITRRPLGLKRATALADAQPHHAVVCVWSSAEKVYDNGCPPYVPDGWWPATATSAIDARGGAL